MLPWLLLGLAPAIAGQRRIRRVAGPLLAMLLGWAVLAAALWVLGGWPGASWLHLAGALLLALGLARATCNLFATRESPESLARRRELGRARDWFERELESRQPQLEDRWFPYLLAFGLAPQVDRWFGRFGGDSRAGGVRLRLDGRERRRLGRRRLVRRRRRFRRRGGFGELRRRRDRDVGGRLGAELERRRRRRRRQLGRRRRRRLVGGAPGSDGFLTRPAGGSVQNAGFRAAQRRAR